MSLIEGVGDEVTNFFICVGVILISYIAWTSTYISDQPLIRTVLILRQTRNRLLAEIQTNQEVLTPAQDENSSNSNSTSVEDETTQETAEPATAVNEDTNTNETIDSGSPETLIQTMDCNIEEASATVVEKEEYQDQVQEVKSSEENKTNEEAGSSEETNSAPEASSDTISIKLKFINDDQRLVTGSLKELLGDFKKRHFQVELDAQKLVKLVFKGQVVQPDSLTLERCGFYDNCVVHCLIHQSHSTAPPTNSSGSARFYFNTPSFQNIPAGTGGSGTQQSDWDLSRLLVSILTLILGAAWYFRYHYSQLFTVTTTVGLFGLTAIFTVSLFGHFFPDQEIRNVE